MIFKFVLLILLNWYPQNKRNFEADQFHFLNPGYPPYNTELKETIGKLFYPHLQRHNPVITKDSLYFEYSPVYDQVGTRGRGFHGNYL